jgi:POT family proton-dependent oligopeptide transporter
MADQTNAVRTVRGHPIGLAVLAGTELAERFSYYGMTALLALYMVKQLLLPGHAENVIGLAWIRGIFESRGPMPDQAFASLIFGWYGGLVYFTPIFGGWIADRWLGRKMTVTLGALLMSAGHLAMSFDATFIIALLLLILGSGLLKGNISAQVGTLYPPDAESIRERGFTIFSTGINIGAVAGPLATGATAAVYGWHAGFALAGVLMLVALGIYLAGQGHLPEQKLVRRVDREVLPPLTSTEKKRVWAIIALIVLNIPPAVTYPMIWNVGLLWIDEKVDLGRIPPSWFNSIDSFASVAIAPVLVALWAYQARRGAEPEAITKVLIGCIITGLSALIFAAGSLATPDGHKISGLWPVLAFAGMGVGFMWYWPITLAIISKAAPAKVNSTLMGGAFICTFFGSVLMGWVGSFYADMTDVGFWIVTGGISFAGSLLTFIFQKPLSRALGLCTD